MPSDKEERPSTSLTKVESNLEEFPFFQLGRKRQEGTATYERTIEGKNGSLLKQRFEVSSSKYSLPGPLDMDVYLAVLELLEIRGGMPKDGKMHFSLYELVRILGWQPGGRTYAKLKESLRRIALTGIESENAFYSKGEDRHISDAFRLWSVHLSDRKSERGGSGSKHHIRFDEWFMRSFQDHYLKGLDTDFYWNLSSPLARRLYRLVDHKIREVTRWETDLFELRRQVPLADYPYASKIRTVLKPAHEELIEKGFLAGVEYPGGNRVVYRITQSFAKRKRALELRGTPEELIAIQTLRDEGMSGDVARDLVAKHGPEHCLKYADALPNQKGLRNPAGWLRKAIEEGYEVEPLPERRSLLQTPTEPSSEPSGGGERGNEDAAEDEISGARAETTEEDEPQESTAPVSSAPDPEAREAWRALAEDLTALRGREALPPWFDQFEGGELDGSTLTVLVPNSTAANHLDENFGGDLLRLWRERTGGEGELEVTMDLASGRRAAVGEGFA